MSPASKPSAISSLFLLAACLMLATAAAAAPPSRHAGRKLLTIDATQSTQSTNGIVGDVRDIIHRIVNDFTGSGYSSGGSGAPCIACSACSSNYCFSVCQQSCSSNLPPIQPIAGTPCIACRDCSSNYCFSVCQQSCNGNLPPIQPIVNSATCQSYGSQAGSNAATSACQTAQLYCNGGSQPSVATINLVAISVTLSQCQNIAFGVCQQTAGSSTLSPCGWEMTNGYSSCSASQFSQFYNGEMNSLCQQQVQAMAP